MRKYGLILAATLAALVIGYWVGRGTMPTVGNAALAHGSDATAVQSATGSTANAMPTQKITTSRSTSVSAASAGSARPTLPAPGTPLKDTFAELQAEAAAGDTAAASRLFRDVQRCADVRRINAVVPRMAESMLNQKADGMSADQLKNHERVMANFNRQLAFANDNAALCADLGDDQINQLLPASMQAAMLGDQSAANCYVAGGASYGLPPGLLDHPEWLAEYKQNALNIANAALQAGDWKMVGILRSAYANELGNSLLSQATGADPAMAYRYQKLLSLRASDTKVQAAEQSALTYAAAQITPQARADADAWAQQEYSQYFSASTQPQGSPRYAPPCQSEELLPPALGR